MKELSVSAEAFKLPYLEVLLLHVTSEFGDFQI